MRSLKRNIEIVVITTFLLFVFLISKSMQVTAAEILPAHQNNIEIEEIKSIEMLDVKNKPLKELSALSEETTIIEDAEEVAEPEETILPEDQEDSADVMPEESKDQAHTEETQVSEATESSVDFSTDEVEENQSQTLAATPAPEYEIQERDGNLYIVNTATGEVRKDNAWVELNGLYYFPNAGGILYRDRAITFGPQTMYYLDHNGAKVMDDVVSYGNELYLLNEEGKSIQPKVGWLDKGDRHYFANEQGKFYRGQWISFGPKIRHYMGADGRAYLGVREVGKNPHLFDDETYTRGVLRRDNAWVEYQGKEYFPNAEGNLYHDQVISFGPDNLYYLDKDGSKYTGEKIVSYNNRIYYFGENGRPKKVEVGWYDLEGKHYFANEQGEFYRNQWISFGPKIRHYMGADGAAYVGVREVGNNLHLFDDRNHQRGVLRKDNAWVEYQGKDYFPNAEGKLYHNQFISFGDEYYYLNNAGSKLKENLLVNGYNLNPDRETGKITAFKYREYMDYYNGPALQARKILDRIGWSLQNAFNYSKNLQYARNELRLPTTRDYANYGFEYNNGNCYVKAATFYYFAKVMNYDVTQVSGYITSLNNPHSWTVINHEGTEYVYDPINAARIPNSSIFKVSYGQSGTLKYMHWTKMRKV